MISNVLSCWQTGHRIPTIENLGVAGVSNKQHTPSQGRLACFAPPPRAPGSLILGEPVQPQDAIDFTDNDIQILGNFPLSPRIQTLLLARNRISTIQPNLPNAIPKLKNLVLASNQLAELSDLDVLGKFARLTHLVLADNPVTRKEVGFPMYSSSFEVTGES